MTAGAPTTPLYKRDTTLNEKEIYIRDNLDCNIEGFTEFRRIINCGTSETHLTWGAGTVSAADRSNRTDTYLDLGKTLYEVVCCLGFAKLALEDLSTTTVVKLPNGKAEASSYLPYLKLCKEFYFHAGCLIDNLARLIYIINDPSRNDEPGQFGGPLRRSIGWGQLRPPNGRKRGAYPAYSGFISDPDLDCLLMVRHFLTHVWSPPQKFDTSDRICWPEDVRTQRVFVWPYNSHEATAYSALTFVPVLTMVEKDFLTLERFQNQVFKQLVTDEPAFETVQGYTISKIVGGYSA
mgnify:CR=1 FL=1